MSFDVTAYYDGSFAGADFWQQDPYKTAPADEDIFEYHHPNSDTTTIVLNGQKARRLELVVACTASDYATLLSAQGSSGTLVCFLGSVSARLLTVGSFEANTLYDIWSGPLTFLL